MALLVVLWGSTLAAIVLGALAVNAHVEGLQARDQLSRTQAFYAAQAGLERAVFSFRIKDDARRWVSDGRPYDLRMGDARVQVVVTDDDGKINLNQADPALLGKLISTAGASADRAAQLVDEITRWGAPGAKGVDTPQLLAPGGFASVEELERLPGMDADLYRRIEPALTLWQTGNGSNLAHASPLVIATVANVSLEQATAFVGARRALPGSTMPLPPLPNGTAIGGGFSPSSVLSISSQATLPDGVSTRLRATVILDDTPGERRTYRVLRWQVDTGT